MTPDGLRTTIHNHWKGLARTVYQWEQFEQGMNRIGKGFSIIARVMRVKHPGIVFANAATIGEIDSLADVGSRLFVGLPVTRCV